MLRNKTFLKLISLVIAICCWIYVMGEVNPETKGKISNIEVSFINTDVLADRDLAVVQKKITTVDVTIKGKRSDVNEIENNGITAAVDVSDCQEGKNTGEIIINLPNGVELDDISEDKIDFAVEGRVEEERPVQIEFLGNGEQSELISWAEDVEPQTVMVSGAESSVNKIAAVKGTVSNTVLTERSKSIDMALIPVTAEGKTVYSIDLDTDNATAHVLLMAMKTVDLDISTENIEAGMVVEAIKGADSIKIVGSKEDLDAIEKISATIDLQGLTSKAKVEIKISLPDNIYLYDKENPPIAEVTLKAE